MFAKVFLNFHIWTTNTRLEVMHSFVEKLVHTFWLLPVIEISGRENETGFKHGCK
jgi:hypothetical protein